MNQTILSRVLDTIRNGLSKTVAEDVIGAMILVGAFVRPWIEKENEPLWIALEDASWIVALMVLYHLTRAIVIVWKEITRAPVFREVESGLYLANEQKERHLVCGARPAFFQAKLVSIGLVFVSLFVGFVSGLHTIVGNHKKNSILEKLDELQRRLPSEYFDEPEPGFSIHFLLALPPQKSSTEHYILDYGQRDKDRFSLYLNSNGSSLVFSVLDSEGNRYSVDAPTGPSGVPLK